jgi:hypothetical protein
VGWAKRKPTLDERGTGKYNQSFGYMETEGLNAKSEGVRNHESIIVHTAALFKMQDCQAERPTVYHL